MNNRYSQQLIQEHFKTLSRGLMKPSYAIAFEAHKNLFAIGKPVIPVAKKKLLEIEWSSSKYKELSRYVSGLYSLLHDLDEEEASQIFQKFISDGCPKHIKAILKSVNQFSVKNYKRYSLRGIEIFEHKFIDTKCNVRHYMAEWLGNVPESDLYQVSRIYIITRAKIDASGTYTPGINAIALLWENKHKEGSLFFRLSILWAEKVLYHEIGHHKYRHEFGVDADQEREADNYAYRIMRQKHHFLFYFLKILSILGLESTRNYYRWGL